MIYIWNKELQSAGAEMHNMEELKMSVWVSGGELH